MSFRFATFGLLAAVLCACSSDPEVSNNPPVIDSVDAPPSLKVEDGYFKLSIELVAHDDDKDAISAVRYRVPAGKIDETKSLPNAPEGAVDGPTQLKLDLLFPANTPKSTYEYSLSVIDARGAESVAVTKSVTLE